MRSFLALSLVTTATAIGSSAIYAVSSSRTLTYTLNKVNGAWAEAHMKVVIMTATAATDSRMESAEETAEGLMPCTCPETDPGATLTPANDISGCYELHIEGAGPVTFSIQTGSNTAIIIFAEHDAPTEFAATLADGSTSELIAMSLVLFDAWHKPVTDTSDSIESRTPQL